VRPNLGAPDTLLPLRRASALQGAGGSMAGRERRLLARVGIVGDAAGEVKRDGVIVALVAQRTLTGARGPPEADAAA